MAYRLTVVRVDPHPQAGEQVPYGERRSGYMEERYPASVETQTLTVELTDEEYAAVKRACVEASK